MPNSQSQRAALFRDLHEQRPLVLPNAWDAASARIIEHAGAAAIATTSAGVAWTYGYRDGEQLTRDEMLEIVARITRSVDVPVTADIEGGYGTGSPEDVAATVRGIVAIGAVGINLEDSPGSDGAALRAAEDHAARIMAARAAAKAAGGDVVINARIDVFLYEVGAPESRFDETVRRAKAYRAAGADCLFVPGIIDAALIGKLVRAIDAPINVMARHGAPSIAELGALGVARVSLGPRITEVALGAASRAAREVLQQGTYSALAGALPFAEVQQMFNTRA